jgi:hypothetical protein
MLFTLDAIAKLFTLLGGPVRVLGTVLIAGASMVFLRATGKLSSVLNDLFWRWFLIVPLVAGSALLTYPVEKSWKWYQQRRNEERRLLGLRKRLADLTPFEKEILRAFLYEQSRTKLLIPIGDAATLCHEGLLIEIPGALPIEEPPKRTYRIAEEVWELLQKAPGLIE